MGMHLVLFQILAVLQGEAADASSALARLEGLLPPRDVPSVPAFYRHLRRGIERGWIRPSGAYDGEQGPGRPARIYQLTRDGREAVRRRAAELDVFTSMALEEGEGGNV